MAAGAARVRPGDRRVARCGGGSSISAAAGVVSEMRAAPASVCTRTGMALGPHGACCHHPRGGPRVAPALAPQLNPQAR